MRLQWVESFKILAHIDNLIYYLNILTEWLIHDVISVTQLEPASQQADSYMRSQNNHFKLIKHKLNDKNYEYYKIESLLNYCLHQYNCEEPQLKYKIKWKDYESKFSSWKTEYKLNYKDLISVFNV